MKAFDLFGFSLKYYAINALRRQSSIDNLSVLF